MDVLARKEYSWLKMSRSGNNVKGSNKFNYYEGGVYDISSFFDFSYYHSKTNVPEINRRCKKI